jgi:paired amphipathic helix protein Sin3a
VLVHKVSNFIGNNHDLMDWFKKFVHYEDLEEVIENKPKAPTGKVALSNCRGMGPSYRLLPRRVSELSIASVLHPCSTNNSTLFLLWVNTTIIDNGH